MKSPAKPIAMDEVLPAEDSSLDQPVDVKLRRRRRIGNAHILRLAALLLLSMVTVFPFYAMARLALMPTQAVRLPEALIPWPLNLEPLFGILTSRDMSRWFFNTLVYAVVSVVLVLLLSSMAGYAFTKTRFPGRKVIFWSFLSMLMVPYQITLIPMYVMMANAGGVNTYWGLIVPTLANVQAVFLMRQFIQTIPDELIDAARVDGCSDLRIYATIVLPLCKPILATLGLFVFLWHWNDFLWPLVMAQESSMQTLTTGVASLQVKETPLNVLLSGALIAFVPIFVAYLFTQRFFREGVVMSGIKG